jgi:hypothetical protein
MSSNSPPKDLNSHLAALHTIEQLRHRLFSFQPYKFMQLAEQSQWLSEGKLAANCQTRSGAQGK